MRHAVAVAACELATQIANRQIHAVLQARSDHQLARQRWAGREVFGPLAAADRVAQRDGERARRRAKARGARQLEVDALALAARCVDGDAAVRPGYAQFSTRVEYARARQRSARIRLHVHDQLVAARRELVGDLAAAEHEAQW